MKTKEVLNEWKSFLEKELLNEISIKKFQEKYPNFNIESFDDQLKKNDDYLDIIKNSIEADEQHSPNDYAQQFELYRNSIEPNRNNKDFLTVNIPGGDRVSLDGKLNQGRCTATYDDIQQFQQARLETGKGNKEKLKNAYIKVLEEASESNFELVAENNEWIIFYIKSIVGSIALARSYWDGNKVTYDETFKAHRSFGQNTGVMKWCTSVSGGGNMFYKYHLGKENHHMYYCIKKSLNSADDDDRKLCISFVKSNKKIQFQNSSASVDGNNAWIDEEQAKGYIGNLYSALIEDVKDNRVEIDAYTYYTSISLDRYLSMRADYEENIDDFLSEFIDIIELSKDKEKIKRYSLNDNNEKIIATLISYINSEEEILFLLNKWKDSYEVKDALLNDEKLSYKNLSLEIIKVLLNDKNQEIRERASKHPTKLKHDLSTNDLSYLREKSPEYKRDLIYDENVTPEALEVLAFDKIIGIAASAISHPKCPVHVLQDPKILNHENYMIRVAIAMNKKTPSSIIQQLAKDDNERVSRHAKYHSNFRPEEQLESKLIKNYIELVLNS